MRVLIADDEELGRRAVARLIAEDERFELVGQAEDGLQALEMITELQPDVAILDLAMPGAGGLEVASRCPEPKPILVFVTAHDRHAVEAFGEAALDYVLKPVDPARFAITLDRVADRYRQVQAPAKRIKLRQGARTMLIDVDDLLFAESQGNYVELHLRQSTHRIRMTLSRLLCELEGTQVVQVHRGFVVHLGAAAALEATDGSHAARLVLKNGKAVPVGRTYRELLRRRFC